MPRLPSRASRGRRLSRSRQQPRPRRKDTASGAYLFSARNLWYDLYTALPFGPLVGGDARFFWGGARLTSPGTRPQVKGALIFLAIFFVLRPDIRMELMLLLSFLLMAVS